MATRTKRIEMRADAMSEERISRAARAQDLSASASASASAFVLGAALREAEHVLGRADLTLMPADQFDALIGSLDHDDGASRLGQAADAERRYRRA